MSARPPWIRFQLQFWELLSYKLSPQDFHAYARLYLASTYTDGRLPLVVAEAAKLAGISETLARRMIDQHPDLFSVDGDYLVVTHAADELADAAKHARCRTEHARRAAQTHWHPRVVEGGGSDA